MKIHQLSSERFLGIISILFLISLYINLGVQPVFLEEPRRAMIAMEMVENDNYIVPTQMGEYYYKKPPVFNWLLILSSKIFGGFSPWALRLPTVLSVLFAGLLLFGIGRRYVDKIFGWQLALLFSTGGAVYYYFSFSATKKMVATIYACLWAGGNWYSDKRLAIYSFFGIDPGSLVMVHRRLEKIIFISTYRRDSGLWDINWRVCASLSSIQSYTRLYSTAFL